MPRFLSNALILLLGFLLTPIAAQEKPEPRVDLYGDPLPPGAIARMGSIRGRPDSMYGGLGTVISPDGKVVVTSDWHESVRIWNAQTGQLIHEVLAPPKQDVLPAAFFPDGRRLIMRGTIREKQRPSALVLDVTTGKFEKSIPFAEPTEIQGISPDGKHLLGVSKEQLVLLSAETGELIETHFTEGNKSQWAQFSDDGKTVVSGNYRRKYVRWSMATGKPLSSVTIPTRWRTSRCSPDGSLLAVVPYSKESVELWDLVKGEKLRTLQGEHSAALYGLTFSPDCKTLATDWSPDWDNGRPKHFMVSIWDVATGQLKNRFDVPGQTHLVFFPDGKHLLIEIGNRFLVYDVATGQQRFQTQTHPHSVHQLHWTSLGKHLISDGNDLRLWETASGRQIAQCNKDFGPLAHLRSTGQFLTLDQDQVHLLDAQLKVQKHYSLTAEPIDGKNDRFHTYCFGASSDEKLGAALLVKHVSMPLNAPPGTNNNQAKYLIWNLADGKIIKELPAEDRHNGDCAGFAPGLRTYVKFTQIFDPSLPVPKVPTAAFKDEGVPQYLKRSHLVVKDAFTGRTLLSIPQPERYVYLHAYSSDAQTIVTSSYTHKHFVGTEEEGFGQHNHSLHFWELATGQERLRIVLPEKGDRYRFQRFAFSEDGRTLVSTREDRVMQFWDVATGQELLSFQGPRSQVYCFSFSDDGARLATGHADGTCLIWDLSALHSKRPQPGPVTEDQIKSWWEDLAGPDAQLAHRAVWGLANTPQKTLALFNERLKPIKPVAEEEIRRHIAALDDPQFARRQAAMQALEKMEELALPTLEKVLPEISATETQKRIEQLLNRRATTAQPEKRRLLRAIEVLGLLGTAQAQNIMEKLGQGAPAAYATRAAQDAYSRRNLQRGTP